MLKTFCRYTVLVPGLVNASVLDATDRRTAGPSKKRLF
jgi:hypothetical protein